MKKIIYPEKKDWMEILRRPALNTGHAAQYG